MGRKHKRGRAHAQPRRGGWSFSWGAWRPQPSAPELLVEVVPEPLDVRTVGMAAGGLAEIREPERQRASTGAADRTKPQTAAVSSAGRRVTSRPASF
jgi:hypothetical protein